MLQVKTLSYLLKKNCNNDAYNYNNDAYNYNVSNYKKEQCHQDLINPPLFTLYSCQLLVTSNQHVIVGNFNKCLT